MAGLCRNTRYTQTQLQPPLATCSRIAQSCPGRCPVVNHFQQYFPWEFQHFDKLPCGQLLALQVSGAAIPRWYHGDEQVSWAPTLMELGSSLSHMPPGIISTETPSPLPPLYPVVVSG